MSKKYKIIFCGIALALVAIIVGLCFVFFGNKVIKATPKTLDVQGVEGEYYLVAEYNPHYFYQFKLEEFIEEEYFTVGVVNSKVNTIKLEDHNLNYVAGRSYRFSVRFVNENGGGKSKFFTIDRSPSWSLEGIDYGKVMFEDDVLSWKAVPQAEGYQVIVVDENLQKTEHPCTETTCDLSGLKAGRYTVYVIAQNGDEYVENSDAGAGKQIEIKRKNILSNAHMSNWVLSVESTYEVSKFDIYADGTLLGKLDAGAIEGGVYIFEDCSTLFVGVDVVHSRIEIKSRKNDCVLESDFVLISAN